MKYTSDSADTVIRSIRAMIQRDKSSDDARQKQDTVSFCYRSMHELGQHGSVFAEELNALESLLGLSPDIEAYRGKGSHTLSSQFVRILQFITYQAIGEINTEEPGSPDAEITEPFKSLSSYALGQVVGKRVRSRRAADLRGDHWQILEDIVERFDVQEIIELARRVACDEKASTPERRGALSCLLSQWDEINGELSSW